METRKGSIRETSEAELRRRLDAKGDERRTQPRIDARLEVEVPLENWDEARRVYTTNISKGGLLLLVPPPAVMAATAKLNLTLPDGRKVSFESEVRHVAKVADGKDYEVGVQFRLSAENQKLLDDALAKLPSAKG